MHPNFNPHAPIMGNNQFCMTSDEQLLEQLRYMSAYGGHNQTTLVLLHELHMRAAQSFGKTFVPTKEVQGDAHLYTSIFKGGRMHHFFVTDDETKQKIAQVIEQTTLDPKDGPSHFGVERIGLLMELGDVFKVVTTDELGKQVETVKNSGFAALFGGWGFDEQTKHSSKVLPLGVIEMQTLSLLNTQTDLFCNIVMSTAAQLVTDRAKLEKLEGYLRNTPVIKEYLTVVQDTMKLNHAGFNHSDITQIHLFPANLDAPLVCLGGLPGKDGKWKWDAGFIKRAQYPHLFQNTQNYIHPNGNIGGFNGGGMGGANWGGPWA